MNTSTASPSPDLADAARAAGAPDATTPDATSPAAIATAFYAAFLGDDLATAAELVTPDVVLHVPGDNPVAGDHEGLDAVLGFVLTTKAILGSGAETFEVLDITGGATHASAVCLVHGDRPGRPVMHNRTVHVLRVEDGRIAEIWFHNWDQVRVDAFWS